MKSNDCQFNTIVLAALLHDLGKFLQKGKFGSLKVNDKHPEVTGNFVRAYASSLKEICNVDLLETLVEKHHESNSFPDHINVKGAKEEYKPLAYMVSKADNYSSSERDENHKGYKNYKTRSLDSVVSRLNIDLGEPILKQYRPINYSNTNIIPIDHRENNQQELEFLLKDFGKETNDLMDKIRNRKIGFKAFFYELEALLLKYAWCIPANSQEKIADISLYDHLKTTSAIAACLWRYHEDKNDFTEESINNDKDIKFNLVVADLSGIQSYLYEGLSMTSGSVAKRLRARSFNINMIMEYAGKALIDYFKLFHSNILISTGGKIYVLLPNQRDYPQKLIQFKVR